MIPNKEKMIDGKGGYITHGLFYETEYSTTHALYSLTNTDKEIDGVVYPSLKKLYLEMEDVTEYEFATTYLVDWPHWQRCCNNSSIKKHIDQWRQELELKLRARALREMVAMADKGNFNAAKFIAGKEWESKRGRPSKVEVEAALKNDEALRGTLDADASRVVDFITAKGKARA